MSPTSGRCTVTLARRPARHPTSVSGHAPVARARVQTGLTGELSDDPGEWQTNAISANGLTLGGLTTFNQCLQKKENEREKNKTSGLRHLGGRRRVDRTPTAGRSSSSSGKCPRLVVANEASDGQALFCAIGHLRPRDASVATGAAEALRLACALWVEQSIRWRTRRRQVV